MNLLTINIYDDTYTFHIIHLMKNGLFFLSLPLSGPIDNQIHEIYFYFGFKICFRSKFIFCFYDKFLWLIHNKIQHSSEYRTNHLLFHESHIISHGNNK